MNPTINFPTKAISVGIQALLVVLSVIFFLVNPVIGVILTSVLAIVQLGSAIHARLLGRTELSQLREAWELIAGLVGFYFATFSFNTLLYGLMDGKATGMILASLLTFGSAVLIALPMIMRIKARHACLPWFIFIGTLLLIPFFGGLFQSDFLESAFTTASWGTFGGLFFMLIFGPLMALTYLAVEWIELDQYMKVDGHTPLDL